MPNNEGTNPSATEEDDIRRRFAAVEEEPEHGDLPPVPRVDIVRPGAEQAGKPPGSSDGIGKMPRYVPGGGMFSGGNMRGSGQALTIGTSLVASIIVGTGAGWLVDKYLLHSGATPWGLIVGFMLGVASGFMNLIRVANQLNKD